MTDATQGPSATLEWSACDDDAISDESLECATLEVPLDHDDPQGDGPSGETIEIALVRLPASTERVGAILFNPGGPGGSGVDFLASGASTVSATLGLEGFDLIGFDPRGVDRSSGIRCLTDAEQDRYAYLDDTPDTPEAAALLEESETAFETACVEEYGERLTEFSTENTARDMDLIRAALGDDQLSYVGISYGSYLGAVYATLFPERVRSMVLDSAFEPNGDSIEQQYSTQLVGFESAFENWAAWCDDPVSGCAFRLDGVDVAEAWDRLAEQLDAAPVAATDGRSGNRVVMTMATIASLYSERSWPVLGAALASVRDDADPDGLFALADDFEGRSPDGTWTTIGQAGPVIRCASGITPQRPDDPTALFERLVELGPRFSVGLDVEDLTDDSCERLVGPVTPPTLSFTGEAPIVVIGGLNDPATPFRWAEELTASMGPSARLVTYTGEGHGFILTASCIDAIYTDVLVDLALPDADTVCEPDPDYPEPSWWDTLPVPEGVGAPIIDPLIASALGVTPSTGWLESRSTALEPDGVLDAYRDALDGAGIAEVAQQEPLPGVLQRIYLIDGEVLSVIAIGPDALADPELGLESVVGVVPDGETLVVLLALPA